MRLLDLPKVLAAAEVPVEVVPGWELRGSIDFAPVGIMLHHTASAAGAGPTGQVALLVNGRADVPGPLVQLYLDRAGTWHVIASGRANHAGIGNQAVLDRVRANIAPLGDARAPGGIGGNAHFLGIEVDNSGVGEPYPAVQLDSLYRGVAGLCLAYGRQPAQIVHHREWTSRKIDMSYRGDVRSAVALHMLALAAGNITESPEEGTAMPKTVATLVVPKKGAWHLTPDGGVLTVSGPFYGSWPGLPAKLRTPGTTFHEGRITVRLDGRPGYTLWSDQGEHFDFPLGNPARRTRRR